MGSVGQAVTHFGSLPHRSHRGPPWRRSWCQWQWHILDRHSCIRHRRTAFTCRAPCCLHVRNWRPWCGTSMDWWRQYARKSRPFRSSGAVTTWCSQIPRNIWLHKATQARQTWPMEFH